MRGKRVPPKEPVDGLVQPTNTRERIKVAEGTIVDFRCSRCRQRLPELICVDHENGADRLWIRAYMAGPWWRWDGNVLRPTQLHREERQRLDALARASTDAGFKRIVREALAEATLDYPEAVPPPRRVE